MSTNSLRKKDSKSQWQGPSNANGTPANGTCTCRVSQYRYIQTHTAGKKDVKSEDWDELNGSSSQSSAKAATAIDIPNISTGQINLQWKNGLPDLEPFLQHENLMYPILESPRKRSIDFLLDIPKIVYELTHVTQTMSWDCGVSCIAMCLNDDQRRDFFKRLDWFCYNEDNGFGTSTWTIDLCYIFAHYGVRHAYFTVTYGVNPDLKRENFYKGIIDRDSQRVNERFRDAEKSGIRICKRSLSIEDIFFYLASKGPLIVLVNANLLVCQKCTWTLVHACRSCCCKHYQGHFIVVLGYNVDRKIVYYRNPALSNRVCEMKVTDFEEARLSFGTDEDLIAVELPAPLNATAKNFDVK